MIIIVSRMRIKRECGPKIIALANELVVATRKETGCFMYRLLQDVYDVDEFCFIEEWKDKEALEAHRHAEHFLRWRENSAQMVEQRTIQRYSAEKVDL